jgi:hypothetical protein
MGIWFLEEYAGYQCPLPPDGPQGLIFFYESLAICLAFYLGAQYECNWIAVYSDNTNIIDMFASLHAKPVYNSILMASVEFSVDTSTTKVYYVPGKQNIVADYLSRFLNVKALQLALNLIIQNFQPSQNTLGAIQK